MQIADWLFTVAAASVAAYVGSMFALGKEKKEKIWTQKQEAYLNIIDALHNLIIWTEEEYSVNFPTPLPNSGKEKINEFRIDKDKSIQILKKHVHRSNLILSKTASEKLESILAEYFQEDDNFFFDYHRYENPPYGKTIEISEHYSRLREIIQKHISGVIEIAKTDLEIR